MNLIMDVSVYELVTLLFTVVAGTFALFQWQNSNKLKRADFMKKALEKTREDDEYAEILYKIDYGEEWYSSAFGNNHLEEKKFDMVFSYFDYLCYLRNKHILSKGEFNVFKYRIVRIAKNEGFIAYIHFLYFYSKKNNTDFSFPHLLRYLHRNRLLPKNFWKEESDFCQNID